MASPIDENEILSFIADYPLWTFSGEKLTTKRTFPHFRAAFAFLTEVALVAESLDHHPEIENVYNKVKLRLCTHDAGGKVTSKDLDFVRLLESVK